MDGFDTLLLQITFEGDIEVRRINADEYVWLELGQSTGEIGANMQQTAQATQHFHNAHHRQLFHLIPGFAAFRLHQRPGNADKAGIRYAGFERADKTGTKNIAGGFSGDQGNRQGTQFSH
ncbi:Uncharacterised protein [Klebsiella michiganensis]|nr:Uncharacterised protein [Klebsiella michiganensis]